MKKEYLFALWGGLFTLCAVLGFIPAPGKALQILMTLLSVAFFVPGGLLLWFSANTEASFSAVTSSTNSFSGCVS